MSQQLSTSLLPQIETGKAPGKHPINFQFEPHKCPLMRRRLSPRIYQSGAIRLTYGPLRDSQTRSDTTCCEAKRRSHEQ